MMRLRHLIKFGCFCDMQNKVKVSPKSLDKIFLNIMINSAVKKEWILCLIYENGKHIIFIEKNPHVFHIQ